MNEHILDQIEDVDSGDDNELNELQLGQHGSPPALHSQNRAEVVGVHEHMDEGVQQDRHALITSGVGQEEQADHDGDTAVVIDVKEGDLAVGLAQNEQEGVDKLPVLLNIENVHILFYQSRPT